MKIFKGEHKFLLHELFYEFPKESIAVPKEFPLEKLFDASGAKKKLMPLVRSATEEEIKNHLQGKPIPSDSEMELLKNNLKTSIFEEKEIEFEPGEIVILKELFDSKKNWSIERADMVKELKDIFYPSKNGAENTNIIK